MINFPKTLVLLGLVLVTTQACNKDDNDPINPFIKILPSGTYSETTCSSGSNSTISIDNLTMALTKESSNRAKITASLPVFGEMFSVIAEYESDTSLIVRETVILDEVYHYGSLIHSDGKYIFSMYDTTRVCSSPNIMYVTH